MHKIWTFLVHSSVTASASCREAWRPSPSRCNQEPLMVTEKDRRPQEDLLEVHCFCDVWGVRTPICGKESISTKPRLKRMFVCIFFSFWFSMLICVTMALHSMYSVTWLFWFSCLYLPRLPRRYRPLIFAVLELWLLPLQRVLNIYILTFITY